MYVAICCCTRKLWGMGSYNVAIGRDALYVKKSYKII